MPCPWQREQKEKKNVHNISAIRLFAQQKMQQGDRFYLSICFTPDLPQSLQGPRLVYIYSPSY